MEKYQITVHKPKTINIEDITREETFNLSTQEKSKALWSFIEENKALRVENEALHEEIATLQFEFGRALEAYRKLKKKHEQLLYVDENIQAEAPEPSVPVASVVKVTKAVQNKRSKTIVKKKDVNMEEVLQLRKDLEELAAAQHEVQEPESSGATTKVTKAKAGSKRSGVHHKSGATGVKTGKSSPYHYVGFVKSKNKYCADTALNDERLQQYSTNEVELALLVDEFIDRYENPNVKKYPRNRDEFPEVMQAYMLKQEFEQQAQERKNHVGSW